MPLEIQILAWGRHKNVVELNLLMGSQPSPLDHRPDFTRTTKKRKSAIRSIEYTIKKKGIATVKSGIKKWNSALERTKIRSVIIAFILFSCFRVDNRCRLRQTQGNDNILCLFMPMMLTKKLYKRFNFNFINSQNINNNNITDMLMAWVYSTNPQIIKIHIFQSN